MSSRNCLPKILLQQSQCGVLYCCREKKSKDQERLEAKQAKQEKKMQEKMEREKKKQEERRRKQEEKERKNRSKDQQARASLGLDNVVHLHEIDMSKQGGRAQAQFIDASTAALF